nr:MAG TPA: hypothetical protein [Caudoviricetes sp.]
MECNIMGCDRKVRKKPCYKTKYKNIVIVKLENKCYSITHYQTGIAITYDRYTSKQKALINLDDVIYKTREIFKRNNIKSLKQYFKQNGIKQINF